MPPATPDEPSMPSVPMLADRAVRPGRHRLGDGQGKFQITPAGARRRSRGRWSRRSRSTQTLRARGANHLARAIEPLRARTPGLAGDRLGHDKRLIAARDRGSTRALHGVDAAADDARHRSRQRGMPRLRRVGHRAGEAGTNHAANAIASARRRRIDRAPPPHRTTSSHRERRDPSRWHADRRRRRRRSPA